MIHQSKQRIKDPVFQLNKTMSGTPGSLGCPLEGLRSAEVAASDSATGTCQTAPTSSGCPGEEAQPVTLPLTTTPPPPQQATGVPTRPTWTTATCLKAGLHSTQEKFRPGSPSRSRKQLRSKDWSWGKLQTPGSIPWAFMEEAPPTVADHFQVWPL